MSTFSRYFMADALSLDFQPINKSTGINITRKGFENFFAYCFMVLNMSMNFFIYYLLKDIDKFNGSIYVS